METIVITPERPHAQEPALIAEMLAMGVSRVHLRHPGAKEAALSDLISSIPADLHCRLTLHDCFQLVEKFPEIGLNLNHRNASAPLGFRGVLSRSCHSVAEVLEATEDGRFDYLMLSPIFPSISKPGYNHVFTDSELAELPDGKVVALGGVTSERIEELKRYPFIGAAFLGAVWSDDTSASDVLNNVSKILLN